MKKLIIILFLFSATLGVVLFFSRTEEVSLPELEFDSLDTVEKINNSPSEPGGEKLKPEFIPPLEQPEGRVTKKSFGVMINPRTSPVQPEKFSGYHTGTDFEVFSDELNMDVPVRAVCSGELLLKKYATGYGGVAVQKCLLNNEPITVIYGHLKLASVRTQIGEELSTGDTLGILGKGFSTETSGERKHLHLGFHLGSSVNLLGYVSNKKDLSGWIDPCLHVCQN